MSNKEKSFICECLQDIDEALGGLQRGIKELMACFDLDEDEEDENNA